MVLYILKWVNGQGESKERTFYTYNDMLGFVENNNIQTYSWETR